MSKLRKRGKIRRQMGAYNRLVERIAVCNLDGKDTTFAQHTERRALRDALGINQ